MKFNETSIILRWKSFVSEINNTNRRTKDQLSASAEDMLGVVEGAAWYTALTTFIAYRLFSASKYSLKTEKRKDWEENIQNILCSGHLTEKVGMEWDLLLDTCIFYLLTKHVFQLYLFILINWIKNNASHPNVLSTTTRGHLLFCLLRRKCACSFIEVIREPP